MIRDFNLVDGQLIVRQTGARIPINGDFFKEVALAGSFIGEVAVISATRQMKRVFGAPYRPKIAFVPMAARPWYAIWPVCHLGGIQIVRDPAEADLLFYFEDNEHAFASAPHPDTTPIINGTCRDIRKSKVAAVFKQVFGYDLTIDPLNWAGQAVVKSEQNGVHDGHIIDCPISEVRDEAVYSRLIDNTQDGITFTDIRTPIVGGNIPIVYLKRRSRRARFSNHNKRVELSTADQMFSQDEQTKICQFALHMGLDFGGMDILRDRIDNRIYIVDVNKTDMGPPTALPRADKLKAIRALGDSFSKFAKSKLQK